MNFYRSGGSGFFYFQFYKSGFAVRGLSLLPVAFIPIIKRMKFDGFFFTEGFLRKAALLPPVNHLKHLPAGRWGWSVAYGTITHTTIPCMQFLYVGSNVCRQLPSDSTSQWHPCSWLILPTVKRILYFHPIAGMHI